MKKRQFLSVAAAFLAVSFLFAGCTLFQNTKPSNVSSQTDSLSSVQSSSSVPQETSSKPGESSSSKPSSTVSQTEDSQPGPVLTIQTDDKEFNEKFKQNPIDKKYIEESNNAISNVDMVNISNNYAEIWQDEITHAYSELKEKMAVDSSDKPKKYQAEQENWEKNKTAALKKISDAALSEGGSMAQVNEASQIMDFYRSRAAQLYHELYGYDQKYTYAYSSK